MHPSVQDVGGDVRVDLLQFFECAAGGLCRLADEWGPVYLFSVLATLPPFLSACYGSFNCCGDT